MMRIPARNTPKAIRGSSIAYRPELDGIRGLAIVIIVFHHFDYIGGKYFGGRGFLAVDIFFVLSGFLITQILLSYRDRGIKLRKFYLRRVARLYPILLVSVVSLSIYLRNDYQFLDRTPAVTSVLYIKNFWPWGGVFGPMWSLSAEEQFYFIFPVILFAGLRLLKRKRFTIFVLLWLASVWTVALISSAPDFNFNSDGIFNLVVFRPSIILVGALIALHKDSLENLVAKHAKIALLLLPVLVYFTITVQFPPLAGLATGLLILALSERVRMTSLIARGLHLIFAFRPLAWIGLLSYSIYIWHLPMIFFSSEHFTIQSVSPIWFFLVKLIAVSCVSFYLFERPVLKLITKTSSSK
jgi:peptidoglycan/LPS O-acetylase OafA/YrhL